MKDIFLKFVKFVEIRTRKIVLNISRYKFLLILRFFFKGFKNTPLLVAGLLSLSPVVFILPLSTTYFRIICTLGATTVIMFENKLTSKYVLGNSFLYFIGNISYSVYLYHWPIILLLKYYAINDTIRFAGKLRKY